MPVPKLVITMALPLMLSLLVQSLYNIVDGIYVGRISEEAFAATSLAYPVQLLMVAVSVGTGVGVNAVASRMVGAKRLEDAGKTAVTGLVLSLLGTVVFMVFGALFLPLYIGTCSGSEVSLAMCERYLRICTIFCLGVFLETLGQRLLQAVGNTMLSMVSLVIGAVTNIILDPILIFGCNMGIEGAAVATVIGQWVGAAVALGLNAATNHEIKFVFKGFRMEKAIVWPIYKVGLPTILTQAMGAIMLFSMNSILGALAIGVPGLRIIAATFVFGAVTTVLGYTCSGLGSGVANMVGTGLRQVIPMVPLAFLFGRLGGVGSIWFSMWISEVLAAAFSVWFTRREFRAKVSALETAG